MDNSNNPPSISSILDDCVLLLGYEHVKECCDSIKEYENSIDSAVLNVLPSINSIDVLSSISKYLDSLKNYVDNKQLELQNLPDNQSHVNLQNNNTKHLSCINNENSDDDNTNNSSNNATDEESENDKEENKEYEEDEEDQESSTNENNIVLNNTNKPSKTKLQSKSPRIRSKTNKAIKYRPKGRRGLPSSSVFGSNDSTILVKSNSTTSLDTQDISTTFIINEDNSSSDNISDDISDNLKYEEDKKKIDNNNNIEENNELQYSHDFFINLCSNMKNNISIKNRRSKFTNFSDCFIGSEAILFIQNSLSISKDKAINIANKLIHYGYIIPLNTRQQIIKDKSNIYYRFELQKNININIKIDNNNSTNTTNNIKKLDNSNQNNSSRISTDKCITSDSQEKNLLNTRKQVLYKKALNSMTLSDIFTFGFDTAKTLEDIINTHSSSLYDNSIISSDIKNSSSSSSHGKKSKLVRTFVSTKRSQSPTLSNQNINDNNKSNNILIQNSIDYFEQFLGLINSYKSSMGLQVTQNQSGGALWKVVFYQYIQQMFNNNGKRDPKSKYILTQKGISSMNNALSYFLTCNNENIKKNKIYFPTATELVEFFSSCNIDPYSVLIGLCPSTKVINEILHEKLSTPLSCNAIPGSLVVAKLKNDDNIDTDNNDNNNNNNIQVIINNNNNNNNDNNNSNVIIKQNYIYGRCLYKVNNTIQISISVYSAHETLSIPGIDCFDLPKHLIDDINRDSEWNIAGLDKFMDNPIDELIKEIMFIDTENIILEYLKNKKGINIDVIKNNTNHKISLANFYELHKANEECEKILINIDNIPKDIIKGIKDIIENKTQIFFNGISKTKLFIPTLEERKKELINCYSLSIPVIIKQLSGNCLGYLDQLKLDRRDLLSGKTKNELVEWWLTEIEKQTNELLSFFSYQFNVLPEEYIIQPPKNINIVSLNLERLNTCKQSKQLEILINNLKLLIYPKIDNFISNSKAVLSAQLDLDLRLFDVNDVIQSFKEKENILKEQDLSLAIWIEDSIDDIGYLSEMKLLENEEYAKNNPNPHIVPVSGLVQAVLARLENEHKTALELWSHCFYDDNGNPISNITTPIVQTQQIHDALNAKNYKLAENLFDKFNNDNILKNNDINIKDSQTQITLLHNTILHSQFKLALKLLKIKSIQVNIPDKERNLPIHYCYSVSNNLKTDQIKLFKKLINYGNNILNSTNIYGETPLHCAALRGNIKLCKLFLDNHINLNILTKKTNESCLHYAVKSGISDIVKILLNAKADPVSRTLNGETPLDIAIRLKLNSIVLTLQDAYNK